MVAGKDTANPKGKAGKNKGSKDDKNVDESFEPIKVDAKLANTAILMLDSPEEEVLQKACESIFKFCEKSDNNRLQIHQLGATGKIFKLVCHEERVIQRNATMVFGLLSANAEIRKFLRQKPDLYLDKMIQLLLPEFDSLTNEYAALWLKNMCEDFSTKTIVASSQGALQSLITMLEAADVDAVHNALGTIEKIMSDYQPRKFIKELKGIDPILNLIKSEFPQIQELAFNSLAKITQNEENREAIRESGGLEKLVEFLSNSEQKHMHVFCLNVLSNCLEDTQCLDQIQQTGGLTRILAYCQDNSDDEQMPQINAAAARAMARSAKKAENRKILNEQFAEKMLIYMLLSDDDETKAAAAHALSVLAESSFCQDSIRNYEGIEILIRLLTSDNSKLREYCCLALSNLTYKNHNNCRSVLNLQGIEPIVNLMKDVKDTTKEYACNCLTNMASDEIIREEVAQYSFGYSILPSLNSQNSSTQSKACLAIASYCVDSGIRHELRTSGAIALIAKLIKSNDNEVRFNACWALTCCSSDFVTAIEFCKHEAIESLRDINNSSQRKNSLTEAALNRILETNLSAKYALNNFLDSTDTIYDGFYDMGPMRPNSGKFYSLEELAPTPVNDKRPIIIVYAPEDKPSLTEASKHEAMLNSSSSKLKSATNKTSSALSSKAAAAAALAAAREKETKTSKGKKQVDSAKKSQTDEANKSAAGGINSSSLNNVEDGNAKITRESLNYGMGNYKPNIDKELKVYFEQIQALSNLDSRVQAVELAKFVADKMGGAISREEISNIGYDLVINEIKYELKSNIIPIGRIKLGTYYHRALLFKVLADKLYLKVTLERGNFNRAWNRIALRDHQHSQPKYFIVDLMHEPGRLMLASSHEGINYIKIQ